MAQSLEDIKHESPSLSPSQQIASQQQRIADIILKTANIADEDQQNDKDVEAEAQKVIKVASMMTEINTQKLSQIENIQAQSNPSTQAPALTAEQQLDRAMGITSKPQKDVKSEVLTQIFKVMDDKEKMHNDIMFGEGNGPLSTVQSINMVQRTKPKKPLTVLEQNSNDFMGKISTFDFGISYDQD